MKSHPYAMDKSVCQKPTTSGHHPMHCAEFAWVFGTMFFILGLLAFRNMAGGLNPVVLADEWTYSSFSRLKDISDSTIPSYLYLLIYKVTNLTGEGFLLAARILNSLFFIGAFPFIYLISRKLLSVRSALWITTLSLLGPINTYSAYFMPESLYFLFFWTLTWMVTATHKKYGDLRAVCIGIVMGIGLLIKFHAFFLFAPLVIYELLRFKTNQNKLLEQFAHLALCIAIAFCVRLLLGYIIAGTPSLRIMGHSYGSTIHGGSEYWLKLLPMALVSLKGHLLALGLLFSPLLVVILLDRSPNADSTFKNSLISWALPTIFILIFITALFTAISIGTGPYESLARLHMRYYNFALPLLFILAASSQFKEMKWGKVVACLCIVLTFILYSFYKIPKQFFPGLIDSPELMGITANKFAFYIFLFISIISTVTIFIKPKLWRAIVLIAYMPFLTIASTYHADNSLRAAMAGNKFTRSAHLASSLLGDDVSEMVIVGKASDLAGMFTSVFCLDNPNVVMAWEESPRPINELKLPENTKWILAFSNIVEVPDNYFSIRDSDFILAYNGRQKVMDFRKRHWPGLITAHEGLSYPEKWGTWSNAKNVDFEFAQPLPEKFDVVLKAAAYRPNVGKPFVLKVGRHEQSFVLTEQVQEIKIPMQSSGFEKKLSIIVPNPVSPKQLQLSEDPRELGIGLIELKIDTF